MPRFLFQMVFDRARVGTSITGSLPRKPVSATSSARPTSLVRVCLSRAFTRCEDARGDDFLAISRGTPLPVSDSACCGAERAGVYRRRLSAAESPHRPIWLWTPAPPGGTFQTAGRRRAFAQPPAGSREEPVDASRGGHPLHSFRGPGCSESRHTQAETF